MQPAGPLAAATFFYATSSSPRRSRRRSEPYAPGPPAHAKRPAVTRPKVSGLPALADPPWPPGSLFRLRARNDRVVEQAPDPRLLKGPNSAHSGRPGNIGSTHSVHVVYLTDHFQRYNRSIKTNH